MYSVNNNTQYRLIYITSNFLQNGTRPISNSQPVSRKPAPCQFLQVVFTWSDVTHSLPPGSHSNQIIEWKEKKHLRKKGIKLDVCQKDSLEISCVRKHPEVTQSTEAGLCNNTKPFCYFALESIDTADKSSLPTYLWAVQAKWAQMVCYVALRAECGRMIYDSLSCKDRRSHFTIARETIIPWPQTQRQSYQQYLGEENTVVMASSHNVLSSYLFAFPF